MSMANLIVTRGISTTCAKLGKRNFRKFDLINKRGTRLFKKMQATNPDPRYPIDPRGTRPQGLKDANGVFQHIPEMHPEIIVPSLKDFTLKPYVTYRSLDVNQEPFTAEDLFYAVYAPKIEEDFKKGQLNEDGNPLNPSPEEKITPQEARDLASKTGADMFTAPPSPLGTVFPNTKR